MPNVSSLIKDTYLEINVHLRMGYFKKSIILIILKTFITARISENDPVKFKICVV